MTARAAMLSVLNRLVATSAVAIMFAAAAHAQASCGATGAAPSCAPAGTQATTTLQRIVFISVTPTTAALTAPTNADFIAGGTTTKTDLAAQVITVRANAAWTLTIKGAAWTGTGNNAKLVGDLSYTKTGGAPFTATTTSAVTLATGAATAASTTTLGYQTAWALATDSPGTYAMALTFTLSSP